MSLLAAEGLGVSFGGVRAVDDVSFSMEPGEIFSIIGPNGAGKTTLFNLVSGVYAANNGKVLLAGLDATGLPPERLARQGLSRTFQNLQIFQRLTAIENVMVGRHIHESRNVWRHLLAGPRAARAERETRDHAMELLKRVKLDQIADRPAGSLPYGVLKRLEIARALAAEPKVLLLDEPAAGCNPTETAEIDALIVEIARSGVGVVLVEHDMKLVMAISDRVHVLVRGRTLVEGKPAAVANDQRVIEAYLGVGLPDAAADRTHA